MSVYLRLYQQLIFLKKLQERAKEDAVSFTYNMIHIQHMSRILVLVTSEDGGLDFLEGRTKEPREDFIVLSDDR